MIFSILGLGVQELVLAFISFLIMFLFLGLICWAASCFFKKNKSNPPGESSTEERLKNLDRMLQNKVITSEEFQSQRNKIISEI